MQGIPNIESFKKRFNELDKQILQSDFYSDQRRAAQVSREHQHLQSLISTYENLETVEQNIINNRAIIKDPNEDPDMIEMAKEELPELEEKLEQLKNAVLIKMIPPEPSESRNIIMEIRAGAGGDEASLFAADLHRMYSRFAETKGWRIEQMSSSESESGGFKEITFMISGEDVYKNLKLESGVHRVQRIPVTETNGRIHTSTATVAVLPEAEEVDIQIDPNDLEITVTRASGPGGQGVNTTDSAVQILHKPTGLIVTCADERSQLKNKTKALKVLRSRLLKAKEDEEREKHAANRKSQVGTGDRSERIRTYNFPQSRLTDHRIGLTLHSLTQVLDGQIEEVIESLKEAEAKEKVEALLNQ
jgi:peptide chain release factor 1